MRSVRRSEDGMRSVRRNEVSEDGMRSVRME